MSQEPKFYSYKKVLVFGIPGVGKSSLTKRISNGTFSHSENPRVELNCSSHVVHALQSGKKLYLNIYEIDIEAKEKYEKMKMKIPDLELYKIFLHECQLAIFMIDVLSNESFEKIKALINLLDEVNLPYLKKMVVCNKMDKESTRQVGTMEIDDFIKSKNNIEFMEISVLNGNGIEELCNKINKYVNESEALLPLNVVKECNKNVVASLNFQGTITIILIGDSQVGKSCILQRFAKNEFKESFMSTIGVDKEIKVVKIHDQIFKLALWDTAGQEKFQSLPKKYYNNADGILLLFDVTEGSPENTELLESFKHVRRWIDKIKENTNKSPGSKENDSDGVVTYLIGNKIDKSSRKISHEEAVNLANQLNVKYFEVSCKTNMNVPEVIAQMVMDCYSRVGKVKNVFTLNQTNHNTNNGGCCRR